MSTKDAQVVQGICTPSGAGVLTPLVDVSTKVRSLLVQPHDANVGTMKIGYDTATPVMVVPLSLDEIQGKVYDLNKVMIITDTGGDKVTFIATKGC